MGAQFKREKIKRTDDLLIQISLKEKEVQRLPSSKTRDDLRKLRLELRKILLGNFDREVNANRANIYSSMNKPSKWMAHFIKRKSIKANIPYIWNSKMKT
ncbi:hypothetical protein GDO78_008490 [Eleutherodactylus coqui]|uniref:Uncharacterized protein n=1 Tax=Eleutherodactylus coqui TaxID=57060 RepID=A0A8J6FD40_ELECQ|nr:hypothetical protein GDO78_008490 [Eleutherodactylus coqui]